MDKPKKEQQRWHEPHLAVREFSLGPGREWLPGAPGWSLVQVHNGTGYCLRPASSAELATGTTLLMAEQARAVIRASQLGELSLRTFNVMPARLTGLMTLGEENFLKTAAHRESAVRIFPPQSAVAVKMRELSAGRGPAGLMWRLKLLQLFVEAFGDELESVAPPPDGADARERLRALLHRTPPGELVEMSFGELARRTHCTPRHLSRIFHELVGMSFRDKRAEIRLARACELLATSNAKVVEVALESGYKSLSLFNLVFTRRFGTSPGRWRQKQSGGAVLGGNRSISNPRPPAAARF